MKISQKCVTATVLFSALALAGCSGSSSSAGSVTPLSEAVLNGLPGSGSGSAIQSNPAIGQVLSASPPSRVAVKSAFANTPRHNSVTQSSNLFLGDDITPPDNDVIEFVVAGSGDTRVYTWTKNGHLDADVVFRTDADGVEELWVKPDTEGNDENVVGEYYKGDDAGHLWVNYAYREDGTDYLATGIWVYIPADITAVAQFETIAFVDGNDEFMNARLLALTGTAMYTGIASGVYADETGSDTTFFDASVNFMANFGEDNELGMISGSITGFNGLANSALLGGSIVLTETGIGTSNNGFFTGDTTATFGGAEYTGGKWGGQFYGNAASGATGAAAQPRDVAGTFGSGAPGEGSILGTFGARRE